MSERVEGICKLCGKRETLTFEHVPPEKAFNSEAVIEFPAEVAIDMITGVNSSMPWEFPAHTGKVNQRGGGGFYLCKECNNNTGAWYISQYVKLAKAFHEVITTHNLEVGDICSFRLLDVYPLRILKAIMTLYCDINNGCMGDDQLRDFLLNKESTDFNSEKYKVFIFMISPKMRRINGISCLFINGIGSVQITEINSYPIGTVLCIDKPESFTLPGMLLNEFARYSFSEKCNVYMNDIPYLEINSLMSCDFRSEEEWIHIINEENKEDENGNGENSISN